MGPDGLRLILAHEIEHALQDQNFGIPDLAALPDDDVRLARSALYEGDAMAVMTAYGARLSLSPRRRKGPACSHPGGWASWGRAWRWRRAWTGRWCGSSRRAGPAMPTPSWKDRRRAPSPCSGRPPGAGASPGTCPT